MKNLILLSFIISFFNLIGQTPELIFHSGFEPNTHDTLANSNGVHFIGIDNSVSPPNDWGNDIRGGISGMGLKIRYVGGNDTMRLAEIVSDPVDVSNKVMQFWIKYPNEIVDSLTTKGRVAANIYDSTGYQNMYYSIRLFLPSDFNLLKRAPAFTWLTLMEFWNNGSFTSYPFRITVNVLNTGITGDSLRLNIHGQTKDPINYVWQNVWDTTNLSFVLPVENWMKVEIQFIEGDANTGRFYLAITPDGGSKKIVCDITNYTYHPDDPNPNGLNLFNPFKLYTSSIIIDSLRLNGGLLNVFWDDFELWKYYTITNTINDNYDKEESFSFYPNPFTNQATLVFDNSTNNNLILEIYDNQGRLVRRMLNSSTGKIEIKRKNLKSGLYLLVLKSKNELVGTGKFVIE